jgi:geranylgeranylglycerol-phosphate geranylgeranyltransferase
MLPQENAVKVFLELMRPLNCLMAGVAAIIGLLIAGGREIEPAALIFLAVFLVTGAGNAFNDYFDREIDAINRPGRPVPSGRVTPRSTILWSLALFIIGCILAGLVNWLCLAIAAANSILLFIYARNLKATPLAGNLCVAYLTGSTFLFGGAVFGWPGLQANLVPFSLSSLATMSREIMKDVEDVEGDRKGGASTLPIMAGERLSGALAAIFSLAAVVLSYQPAFGIAYLAIVAAADVFFLAAVWKITKMDASGSQRALKMGMAVALASFFAAAVLR